jgi:hypothetical protein
MDLIIVGICVTLSGRAVRWYIERDVRLLRNIALIVLIAWSRWILEGTSNVLIKPEEGYSKLIFAIIVGILIGIASSIVALIIHRSAKGFFKETKEGDEKLGES